MGKLMLGNEKVYECAKEGRWIGFDNTSKGHRIYWPTRRTISMEYDVNFTPAPDPPLLEGKVGEVLLDFDNLYQIEDPPVKTDVEAKPDLLSHVNQSDQAAVNAQSPNEHPAEDTLQSETREESIPKPLLYEDAPAIRAPANDPGISPTMTPPTFFSSTSEARTRQMNLLKPKSFRGSQDKKNTH